MVLYTEDSASHDQQAATPEKTVFGNMDLALQEEEKQSRTTWRDNTWREGRRNKCVNKGAKNLAQAERNDKAHSWQDMHM